MRGLLSVLRDDSGRSVTTNPGLKDVRALVVDAHRNGLTVKAEGISHLSEQTDTVPQLVQFTVYRIIQEMLTNMLKYSPDKRGSLTVTVSTKQITVTASNALGATKPAPATGSGFGLRGMAERATAIGGTVSHSDTDGTFTVSATLPTGSVAA